MRAYRIRLEHGGTRAGRICILGSATPAISWAVSARQGQSQQAYRLTVTCGQTLYWDTGWVQSTSQQAVYEGSPLTPGEVYQLQIRLRDSNGEQSEPAEQMFCPGALDAWRAPWIRHSGEQEDTVLRFVRDFTIERMPVSAALFVCGLGYHKAWLNGVGVLTQPMNPSYSQYDKRCYYAVLPALEAHLQAGANRLSIEVAPGWRTPHNICYKLVQRVAEYTGVQQLSAILRLRYADGTEKYLTTAEDWRCLTGPTTYSNIFIGEHFDARRIQPDWSAPGAELPGAQPAEQCDSPAALMCPDTLEPITEQEQYNAVTVAEVAPGVYGVDFGQNIAGVCRIRIPRGIKAGTVIELHHAEILDEDGLLYTAPLRGAASVDRYTAAGGGLDPEYWQPQYTYHGFRYAQVHGYPQPLCPEDIQAIAWYTDIATNSDFRCGEALVNAIQKNIVLGEKGNLHSLLTDCPQRDERMAWMNDATVRFEETPYNFDIGRLFPKVVRDCMDVQDAQGAITCTAPYAFGSRPADPVCTSYLMAGWQAYLHTGNRDILAEGYAGFAAWNAYLHSRSEQYIVPYSYYGDWASPAYACISPEHAVSAVTPGELMSTGYFYYNAVLLARMADILGKPDEAARQRERAGRIREAFLRTWWQPDTGIVGTGSQGCQAFALWLDILPPEGRQKAADRLHDDLVAKEYRFTTGNLCTRYIMDALTRYGYLEDAWKLATRQEYPSLGYMIQQEATTVWERFELKKDPGMNSHNHPMYGAIGYWFYAYLVGAVPTAPGWQRFSVRPYAPAKLLSASAEIHTPYGDATVRWVKRYGRFHLYVGVPHGTQAQVTLPGGHSELVGAGQHHLSEVLP